MTDDPSIEKYPWLPALDRAIARWIGTRWQAGQAWPGRGVDCVRFVDCVLQQVRGVTLPPLPRLPQDLAQHEPKRAAREALSIAARHPHTVVRDGSIEPGDVLVVRIGGGPTHPLIVARPPVAWHSIVGYGVCRTSLVIAERQISRVFRLIDRELWK